MICPSLPLQHRFIELGVGLYLFPCRLSWEPGNEARTRASCRKARFHHQCNLKVNVMTRHLEMHMHLCVAYSLHWGRYTLVIFIATLRTQQNGCDAVVVLLHRQLLQNGGGWASWLHWVNRCMLYDVCMKQTGALIIGLLLWFVVLLHASSV